MSRKTALEKLAGLPDWPAMLTAETAAAYVSLPLAAFERAVAQGELPAPQRLGGRLLWSRRRIDARLDPVEGAASSDHDPVDAAIAAAFAA